MTTMPQHHDVTYVISARPLTMMRNDVQQRLPVPVQVLIKFDYRIEHRFGQLSDRPGETVITREQVLNRYGSCQLNLTEFKCRNLSFSLLSQELSNLGVEQEHHKKIVRRIVNLSHFVGTQIKMANHKVGLVPIQVKLLKYDSVWQCLRCFKKESSIKNMLEKFLVTSADQAKADRQGRSSAAALMSVEEEEEGGWRCSVCLEEFGAGTYAVRTPCSHEFHEDCVVAWLLKKPSCPLCRFDMPI